MREQNPCFSYHIITKESSVDREVEFLEALGTFPVWIHVRKPHFSINEMRTYLSMFSDALLGHIILHDFFSLHTEFPLIAGFHENGRFSKVESLGMDLWGASCHSLIEIRGAKCHYKFLSPIFDSISKRGYQQAFVLSDLKSSTVIDESIIALGGITPPKVAIINGIGFGGVALLGYIWCDENISAVERFRDFWNLKD